MAKRGRPRGPCNPRELAQRRGAAWKHGDRAATPLRRAIHPCREDLCPVGYPCDVKSKIEAAGGALEACIVELGISDEKREAFRRLLDRGDRHGVLDMLAKIYAAMHGMHEREALSIILEGGFAIQQPVLGRPDPEGHQDVVGHRLIQNPRAIPFIEFTKILGLTGDQQAVTPKSRGETRRDVSVSEHLDWLRNVQGRLGTDSQRGLQAPTEDPPLPHASEGTTP